MRSYAIVPCLLGALALLAPVGRAVAQTPDGCAPNLEMVSNDPEVIVDVPQIVRCGGAAGTAAANALRASTTITNADYWRKLAQIADDIRHPALLSAALDVARSGAATVPARAVALQVALRHFAPGATFTRDGSPLTPAQLVAAQVDPAQAPYCVGHAGAPARPFVNSALASGYERGIADMADQVSATASAPAGIRAMAQCLRVALLRVAPPVVDPAKLHIARVCGRRVKVTNDHTFAVMLSLRVHNTDRVTRLYARPGETIYPMGEDGVIVMEVNGTSLGAAQIGDPCPS